MPVLPASVRLALWASAAYGGLLPLQDALHRTAPDADAVDGDLDRVGLWRDFGELVVLVALPRPGDVTGMPSGSPDLLAAATAAGECVFVPGLGGALVPEVSTYGPAGDLGTRVTWTAYDAEPMATHRVEALSLAEVDLQFTLDVRQVTDHLDRLDVRPWAGDPVRAEVDARLAAGRWGLPEGMPPRAVTVISAAARVSTAAEVGLAAHTPAADITAGVRREDLLRRLRTVADSTLATATNVAALHLAGLRG